MRGILFGRAFGLCPRRQIVSSVILASHPIGLHVCFCDIPGVVEGSDDERRRCSGPPSRAAAATELGHLPASMRSFGTDFWRLPDSLVSVKAFKNHQGAHSHGGRCSLWTASQPDPSDESCVQVGIRTGSELGSAKQLVRLALTVSRARRSRGQTQLLHLALDSAWRRIGDVQRLEWYLLRWQWLR